MRHIAALAVGAAVWLLLLRPGPAPAQATTAAPISAVGAEIGAVATLPTIESLAGPTPAPIPGRQAELWPGAAPCFGYHAGATDWCAPQGTEVHAPADCVFASQGTYHDDLQFGAYVMCNTESGLEIYVGHLDMATVNPLGFQPGSPIEAGQTLGFLGYHMNGSHSHVQLRRGGQLVSSDAWWTEWDAR